jgi:hypothetical protein
LEEVWRDIPGYEGLYKVSDFGRVKAYPRKASRGRALKYLSSRKGYLFVSLSSKCVVKRKSVHSLVCLAFIGPRPDGYGVNHKDGDKENNGLWNLEYASPRENLLNAVRRGALKRPPQDRDIYLHNEYGVFMTSREAANASNYNQTHFYEIVKRGRHANKTGFQFVGS